MQENNNTVPHNKNGVSMKKTLIVTALAVILLMAFSGTALAKGYNPGNRSSSFLDKGESYVAWDKAQATMLLAGESAENTVSVHGNYTTTTVKCQVCHSAHKASATGDTLLQSTAAQACVPCHLGATASSDKKVSAGNRHGGTTQCTNGYCHSISPHGAGDVSKYDTLASAMLTDHGDSLLDAAVLSGSTSLPQQGYIFATGSDASLPASRIATMTVYNPGVTAALLNDVSTPAAISLGRAVGTGYICANGGCHMNGAFNSLTENATFSAWGGNVVVDAPGYAVVVGSVNTTVPAGTYATADMVNLVGVGSYNAWDALHMRKTSIKGHTLAAVANLGTRDVAFANVGACKSCHDSIDYRISSTTKQFPHGNNVISSAGVDEGKISAAWFTIGAYLGSPDSTTTVRGTGKTSGSDGACLKCHRADGTTNGVGLDY